MPQKAKSQVKSVVTLQSCIVWTQESDFHVRIIDSPQFTCTRTNATAASAAMDALAFAYATSDYDADSAEQPGDIITCDSEM